MFRMLVKLLGTLQVISPGYDIGAAAPSARRRGGDRTDGAGDAPGADPAGAISAGPALARTPREIDELARALLRGELGTRVSLLSEAEDVRLARGMVNRVVSGLVGSAIALSSALLLTVQAPSGPGGPNLINLLGGIGLFFSMLLLLRPVAQILRERD